MMIAMSEMMCATGLVYVTLTHKFVTTATCKSTTTAATAVSN